MTTKMTVERGVYKPQVEAKSSVARHLADGLSVRHPYETEAREQNRECGGLHRAGCGGEWTQRGVRQLGGRRGRRRQLLAECCSAGNA